MDELLLKKLFEEQSQLVLAKTGIRVASMVELGKLQPQGAPSRYAMISLDMFKQLRDTVGPMITQIAADYAAGYYHKLRPLCKDPEETMRLIAAMGSTLTGFGVFELLTNSNETYGANVYNSLELELVDESDPNISHRNVCTYTLGFIKGVFEAYLGKRVAVTEKLGTKADKLVQFIVTPKE